MSKNVCSTKLGVRTAAILHRGDGWLASLQVAFFTVFLEFNSFVRR